MAESQLHALPNAVPHELPSPNRPRSSTNGDPPAVPTNTPLLQPQHSFASATTVESDSEQFALTGHWHGKHPTPTDSMTASLQNCVFIKNLALSTVVGPDAWGNHGKPQPILISCRVHREIGPAGENDQVDDTLSYSQIVKDIKEVVSDYQRDRGGFTSARNLSETIFLKSYRRWGAYAVCITIHLPKANLRAEGGFILTSMYHEKLTDRLEESIVSNFRIPCIIGVNPHERLAKQIVVVSFKIIEEKDIPGTSGSPGTVAHWAGLSKEVVQIIESSSFQTVEALATQLADHIIAVDTVLYVNVSVEKPNAIASVEGSGCEVNREKRRGEHFKLVNEYPLVRAAGPVPRVSP